nr:hypothetical protein BJQ95_00593 [Cryobacterium sp. SO1]
MWVPIPVGAMQHIIAQAGPAPLPDRALAALARRFFVPESTVFHFSAKRRLFGRTSVTLTTQSAFRFDVGTDATPDVLHVAFLLNGRMGIRIGGGPMRTLRPISGYTVPGWDAMTLEATEMTRGLAIQLPQSRLADRGVRVRSDSQPIDDAGSLGLPLRLFALSIVDSAWSPSGVGTLIVERTIEDLVVGLLLEGDGYAMDGEVLRIGLRARARAQIDARHRDPDLSPATLAAQLGVSLRHLQRAFEGSGDTVAHEIGRARAESAAVLLTMPHSAGLTISDVAAKAGFSSTFELRAGFKARYAMLPSEYRSHRLLAGTERNSAPRGE